MERTSDLGARMRVKRRRYGSQTGSDDFDEDLDSEDSPPGYEESITPSTATTDLTRTRSGLSAMTRTRSYR